MPVIYCFVKLVSEKWQAEDLMRGKLFANRLSYYKGIEEAGRGDKYEGAIMWHRREFVADFIMQVLDPIDGSVKGAIDMTPDIAGPIIGHSYWIDSLNVFCFRAVHSGDLVAPTLVVPTGDLTNLSSKNICDLRRQLRIPEEFLELGKYAVVIQAKPFLDRVKVALRKCVRRWGYGFVRYFDPETFHGDFLTTEKVIRAAFWKRDEYRYQSEYRIAMHTGTRGNDARILEIGDIRDISKLYGAGDVNRDPKISLT